MPLSKFLDIDTYERVKKIEMDNQAVLEAALDQKYDEGMAEGVEKGKAEGKKEALQSIARELLARGISINEIRVMTSLTVEEIKGKQ